jgi:hypothetical protein
LARDYEGQLWTQSVAWEKSKHDPEAWGIKTLTGKTDGKSLSKDPKVLHTGQNSGFAAVGLAYHLAGPGCRIILLGFDMMKLGNDRHWFGAHPGGMEVESNYNDFMRNFGWIDCANLGIEIWNCTRRTALSCFPCYNLDDL